MKDIPALKFRAWEIYSPDKLPIYRNTFKVV